MTHPGAGGGGIAPLVPKDSFILPGGAIWLNWAQTGPSFADASPYHEYCRMRTMGAEKSAYFDRLATDVRALVAKLLGGNSNQVFFGANTTSVIHTILGMVNARPGGRRTVVTTRQAFPSLPLAACQAQTRWVEASDASYLAAINQASSPTLVLLESQEYRSGRRYDVVSLAEAARARGGLVHLLVDISQWPDVRLTSQPNVHFAFSGAKWAGAPNGIAVGMLNAPIEFAGQLGWASLKPGWTLPIEIADVKDDAARLDAGGGGKPWLSLALLRQGLLLINALGRQAIESHVLALAQRLRNGLYEMGIEPLDLEPGGQVAFNATQEFYHQIESKLIATYALGRVRLSPGPWSSSDDTDQALSLIQHHSTDWRE